MPKAPSMPLQAAITVSFSELFGRNPSFDDAREILGRYQRSAVLLMLAKLSAVLKTWLPMPAFDADRQLAKMVFRDAARSEYHVTRDNAQRVFFPRIGILATARLALEASPAMGGPIDTPAASAQILKVCLMMNELVSPGDVSGTLEFLAHQLPYHNASVAQRFQADLVRSMEMFEEYTQSFRGKPGMIDLAARFEQVIGVSPRCFAELALLAGALYVPVEGASFIVDDPAFFLRREFFAKTSMTAEQISAFLAGTARTDEELSQLASARGPRPLADTTVFQAYPLIRRTEEECFCLDLASLLDKAGRGLYWTIATGNALALGGTYGKLFEAYLHGRVNKSGVPAARYLPNPLFEDGVEVCDGMFVEGTCLILCEYKSSVLPAAAKVGGDPVALAKAIDKAFITGDADGRKGVAQLSNSLRRILDGDTIQGLPCRDWTLLYPVMVCLDAAMTCPGMSAYINEMFARPRRRGSKTRITRLTLIDVEDYEGLLADIAVYPFDELLDSYYRAHVSVARDQIVRFRRFNIPYLQDKPQPADIVETRFRQFFADFGPRVFNEPSDPALMKPPSPRL